MNFTMGEKSVEERLALLEFKQEQSEMINAEQAKLLESIDTTLAQIKKDNEKQKGMIGGVVLTVSGIVAGLSFIKEWGGALKTLFITIAGK